MDQLNQEPIYVMMVTVDKKWQKIEIRREKEVPVRRSAVSARYWRKHLEKTEAEKILREKLVLEAGTMGKGGEIFVFDMGKPVKIVDLAKRMISLLQSQPPPHVQCPSTG